MRVSVYARYSSDQQSGASIDDQIRLCKERITAEGWHLEQVYRDAAISGSSAFRPGYQTMLEAVRDGGLDIVLAEALDRLSRDQEDVAGLYKMMIPAQGAHPFRDDDAPHSDMMAPGVPI
jgi:DNA invertase Pin-like site-specific DNA recombinase